VCKVSQQVALWGQRAGAAPTAGRAAQTLQRNAAASARSANRETLAELLASFLATFSRAIHHWGSVPELRRALYHPAALPVEPLCVHRAKARAVAAW
jgi:hypothetical protein